VIADSTVGAGAQPAVVSRLRREHGRMRRALDVLEQNLAAFAATVDRCGIRARIRDLQALAEPVHRFVEDQLMDLLLQKGLTPAERRVVFLSLGEKQALIQAAGELCRTLGGDDEACGDLAEQLAAYLALQRRHLARDDEQLIPLAITQLTDAEWELLRTAAEGITDRG
jgi:hemerythrin-like domain-containing protein